MDEQSLCSVSVSVSVSVCTMTGPVQPKYSHGNDYTGPFVVFFPVIVRGIILEFVQGVGANSQIYGKDCGIFNDNSDRDRSLT